MSGIKKTSGFNKSQQEAVNPTISAFVQANAGTGKTAVLTGRLLRILFSVTDFSSASILCLTYTKAGASEMNNRILKEMRKLAVADDDTLAELIEDIIRPRTVTSADLRHARDIFFSYIDNPDILKVKTIHGFCEEILHRFPLEAGLSPSWQLVTEAVQNRLWRESFYRMINNAKRTPDESVYVLNAFEKVVEKMSDSDMALDKLVEQLSKQYKYFFKFENFDNYRKYFIDTTQKILELQDNKDTIVDADYLQNILKCAEQQKKQSKNIINIINNTRLYIENAIDFEKYKLAYLTTEGGLRKKLSDDELLLAEQNRVYKIHQRNLRQEIFENTMMLFDLSAEFAKTYKQIKKERDLLDFEDLILYTKKLLGNQDTMGWILSQLNTSINHILIDEAQDTAPDQWEVIMPLISTILSIPSMNNLPPTAFIVGDTKQSIYSFQGADPAKFSNSRQIFEKQLSESRLVFKEPVLDINYRSTEPVLKTVDEVFNNIPGFINNTHRCSDFNKSKPGLVEVHKLQDVCAKETTLLRYIDEIVEKIKSLIDSGQFKASDIMVLVRTRAPMAPLIVKKMKQQGIPVAGSDSIILPEFSAIRDLMYLIRFCIDKTDDYSLCCVLKSPIFRLKEQEIFKICNVKKNENSVRRTHDKNATLVTVFDVLKDLHNDIFNDLQQIVCWSESLSAYSFFTKVLAHNDIRKKMIGALGEQIIEPLEEFLNLCLSYERTEPGTMRDFLKWFITSNTKIKRDINQSGGVRVITVHGSKGLQAGAVFLIDTATLPHDDSGDIIQISADTLNKLKIPYNTYYPLPWVKSFSSKIVSDNLDIVRAENESATMAEYYRLLYVAMTRACQNLYIYGCRAKSTPNVPEIWINQVWNILSRDNTRFTDNTKTVIRITNEK